MRTIGTDISLDVCKAEGYLMMEFDARKKFSPTRQYKFIAYYPEYIRIESIYESDQYMVNTEASLSYIWEYYSKHKTDIDEFADVNYNSMDYIKDEYNLLYFADSVNAWCGILR